MYAGCDSFYSIKRLYLIDLYSLLKVRAREREKNSLFTF